MLCCLAFKLLRAWKLCDITPCPVFTPNLPSGVYIANISN